MKSVSTPLLETTTIKAVYDSSYKRFGHELTYDCNSHEQAESLSAGCFFNALLREWKDWSLEPVGSHKKWLSGQSISSDWQPPVDAEATASIPLLIQVSILTNDEPSEVRQEKGSEEKNPFRQMLKSLWPVLLVACSVTTLFGLLQYLIGPILQERFSYDGVSASRVLSMLMMVAAFSTVVAHLLVSRFAQGRLILSLKVGSVLLLFGSFLLITSTQLICLIFGLVISAASIALLTPAYTTLASEQVGQQGVLTGTLAMIHTLGYTMGALLAGLGGSLGIQMAEVFCIFLAVLLLMISFLLVESPKKRSC